MRCGVFARTCRKKTGQLRPAPLVADEAMANLIRIKKTLACHGVVSDDLVRGLMQNLGKKANDPLASQLAERIDRFDYSGALESARLLKGFIKEWGQDQMKKTES